MRLLETKTGKAFEAPDSYGLRLIEQGRAVLAPEKKPAAKPEKSEPAKAEPKKIKAKE